jgi:two-component system chemotaxis response regulator CheY
MKHIMVVDDSITVRTSVAYALNGLGYSIAMAENGSEALDKVKIIKDEGGDVALCIVDINMPVMDGITFIGKFRMFDKFTPVLVLTTESQVQIIKAGREKGASGWIIKPFKNQDMVNVVQKLVR